MFASNEFSKFAVAGALTVVTTVGTLARADDQAQNLGPAGPHEPILASVGSKRVIAFYLPGSGQCALHAVVWNNNTNADNDMSATRVRVSLEPGQIVHIDSAPNESLNLQCGKDAEKLAVVDNDSQVASGMRNQHPGEPARASVSGF